MIPDNNIYPYFEVNQVLSADHLNTLATRLDEQERLTRATLHGIGIVCGMEVSVTKSGGKARISISKGYGVTSEGYPVIIGDEGFKADRYRTLEVGDGYKPLLLDDVDGAGKLLELLDSSHEHYDEGIEINAAKAQEMAVVLYVELLETSLKTCTPGSCDDKGKKVTVSVRKLLVPTAYLDALHEEVADEINKADAKGDFFPNLATRLDLPDLRMPRFDIPASALTNAESIIAAYEKILIDPLEGSEKSLFKRIGEALDATRTAYAPLLDKPEFDFATELKNIESGFLNPARNRAAAFQYHYDFLNDLIDAYDEFRAKAFELTALCNPPSQLYPRHLELGELEPSSGDTPSAEAGILAFRHSFRPSPALGELKTKRAEVQSLYNRLRAMVASFDLPTYNNSKSLAENIRVTPSRAADAPLSLRAIPCYYDPNDPKTALPETWDFAKTAAGRSDLNCGSRIDGDDSINWSLDQCGFFRIEGHTGLDADKVLEALQKKIATHRLPFDVLVLKTETPPDDLDDDELQGYLTEFLKKHPGIEHTSGVMPGGTFVMVCNKAGSTSGSPYNPVLSRIGASEIVADFALPYRVAETLKPADISVGECQYAWIDSVRHLNNITMRDYRKQAIGKAPAAREAEASRLATNYVLRIRKYEIQGRNLLGSSSFIDVSIPLSDLKKYGHAAIVAKLNQTFPLGAVFDHTAGTGNVLIRSVRGQRFRIELEGVQGNRIRYAYTEAGMFRFQNDNWEQIDGAKTESGCRMIAEDYDEKVYRWIQKTFKPASLQSTVTRPTIQDIVKWEKMALKRARRYKSARKLPIYASLLSGLASAIRSIDPDAKIVLVGSWGNGSWLSRIESENIASFGSASQLKTFRTLNQKVTGRSSFSGIDLLIDSKYAITPDMIPVICGYPITIYKGKKDAQKGLEL
ncbi:hypothetical protein EST62_05740 [Chlorobaculum sp. 24CR]|uniref:hypothetical protein n=1 Tax=Chlorobaculum sp. 24CR TaxID=2508878 RepID=UPI00100AE01E|nr:hypothetical protein [Chlorobaculum sp. 24CR]RXK87841.1 hypothetical protein EST62_05740 [Chlorobaculum sp. 24CR]